MSRATCFTKDEIKLARFLRKAGKSWHAIARVLGRAHGDGIRRRLDPEYHLRRNRYQANYMAARKRTSA